MEYRVHQTRHKKFCQIVRCRGFCEILSRGPSNFDTETNSPPPLQSPSFVLLNPATLGLVPPTWGQLGSLHYVRLVLQEVMRLYPAVVLNARVATKPPYYQQAEGMGMVLEKNPDMFYPERWEELSADMPGYIPFNKGPRSCPGQYYAMIVLTYIVARIFPTFSKVSSYNTKEWTERISMTFENENGVLIGLS